MARILLATIGSLGDLHPMLALALELRQRGHRAEIATTEFYREKITALGVPFHPLRPEFEMGNEVLVRQIMDGRRGSELLLRELMFPAVRAMHTDLSAIVAGGIDLLVSSEIVYAARLVAEQSGVPWASFSLAPLSLFSAHDPSLMPMPPGTGWLQSLGPGANRLLKHLAERITWPWWEPVRALRRELGLPPGRSPLFDGKFSPLLDLAMFSPVLQPRQPDWPAQTVQTGFPFYEEAMDGATLPPAVERFLDAGEPPVVFTLGSAAIFAADDFFTESAHAAQLLGRRALLLVGKNPVPSNLPPSVLTWDYLPFAKIFPRAAASVHQGGVGTTAQALRAGRPMLVVPFAHDQPDNAARVTRLGLARTLARARYRARRVARELAALLDDPVPTQKADAAGARVRAERGTVAACDALERALVARS